MGQQCRRIARAGADLQHRLAGLRRHGLQHPGVELRGQDHLTAAVFVGVERDLGVGKGHAQVLCRHEQLAWHTGQDVQHAGIVHPPRTDLLFDHVETGLLDVHGGLGLWAVRGNRAGRGRRRTAARQAMSPNRHHACEASSAPARCDGG